MIGYSEWICWGGFFPPQRVMVTSYHFDSSHFVPKLFALSFTLGAYGNYGQRLYFVHALASWRHQVQRNQLTEIPLWQSWTNLFKHRNLFSLACCRLGLLCSCNWWKLICLNKITATGLFEYNCGISISIERKTSYKRYLLMSVALEPKKTDYTTATSWLGGKTMWSVHYFPVMYRNFCRTRHTTL